jgi:HD-GYP domain-containing protein (c-di-GMP phosphodiesterase class II)
VRTGLVVHASDGSVTSANATALELLALREDEILGLTSSDPRWGAVREDGSLFPGGEHPVEMVLRTGEACVGVTMGIDNPGRARRWLSIDAYPVISFGQVKGVISSFDDITDQRRVSELVELLLEMSHLVATALDDDDFLQQMCNAITTRDSYPLAWIGVAVPGEEELVEAKCAAGDTGYLYEGLISWSGSKDSGKGPTGTALRTGTTQIANDLSKQPAYDPWRERVEQFGLASSISIPFRLSHHSAVLVVYGRHVDSFGDMTARGLEEICREAEFCLDHLRAVAQLARALDGTIQALSFMTETRDPYTAGHQSQVGSLSLLIGRRLGLDAMSCELVRQSGELHDIGKIIVPAEILTFPGRLTELEFELVKQHTTVGGDILTKASLPWPIAEVALQHHERMDGSGYPKGLSGDDIIMPARIVAVADVVESMMQHRPYRPALGKDKALEEIVSGAGSRYDQSVVDACLDVFDDGFSFPSPAPAPPA